MNAVIALLDEVHSRQVEAVWGELRERFGLRGIEVTPYPHFSFQIARGYDLAVLAERLQSVARRQRPLVIRTGGLAVFTGPNPVLYIPVVRTDALSRLHEIIWEEVTPLGTGVSPYYEPDRWLPHITLAHGDLTLSNLGPVMEHLAQQDFSWEIPIDHLGVIRDTGERHVLRYRFELSGT